MGVATMIGLGFFPTGLGGKDVLTQTAEYALRAVCTLAARDGRPVPASELANQAGVPTPYLAKIMQQLASTDLVTGRRGIGGGYALNKDPHEISILDVILAVGQIRMPRKDEQIVSLGDGLANLHRAIDGAAESVIHQFRTITIDQVHQDLGAVRSSDPMPIVTTTTNTINGAHTGQQTA